MKQSRRNFLKHASAGAAGFSLFGSPNSAQSPSSLPSGASSDKYNVLFIAVDDLNDWVGCMGGHPQARTPHIDKLAKEGLLFERGYCPAPLCNPSRTALLTGLSPAFTGVYNNQIEFRQLPWSKDVVTLPQHFRHNGYRTFGGGKVFHTPEPELRDPPSWDEYYSDEIGTPWPEGDFPKVAWDDNGPKTKFWYWGQIDAPKEDCGDWRMCRAAADVLRREHAEPFFLAAGVYRPHLPFFAPKAFFKEFPLDEIILPPVYQNDLEDIPPFALTGVGSDNHRDIVEQGHWRRAVQAYLASIAFADACIGELLNALDNSPCRDNTIVVLWGDHGWHLGEKEHWAKFTLWEEANHCPLIIKVPGMTDPDTRCHAPVTLQDLYPTLLELCQLPSRPEHPLHGRSLVPLLKQPSRDWPYPAVMTHGENNHAVRDRRWTYIRYRTGGEELYDIQKDPMEWHNLADKPGYAKIKEDMARWMPDFNRPKPV